MFGFQIFNLILIMTKRIDTLHKDLRKYICASVKKHYGSNVNCNRKASWTMLVNALFANSSFAHMWDRELAMARDGSLARCTLFKHSPGNNIVKQDVNLPILDQRIAAVYNPSLSSDTTAAKSFAVPEFGTDNTLATQSFEPETCNSSNIKLTKQERYLSKLQATIKKLEYKIRMEEATQRKKLEVENKRTQAQLDKLLLAI